jgi:hypothetical protein
MAANEARALGRGGISEVSRACGLSRKAIAKGIREIDAGTALPPGRVRQPGAGRKKITDHDPRLAGALERLIDPDTRGDPETPLRWTCKSTRTLAAQLTRQRHPISHMKVAQLLHAQGYSLQGNRKTQEGGDHPDRDAQFRHINRRSSDLAKERPSSRWTPRRRSWWETTRTLDGNGCRRRSLSRSRGTTSQAPTFPARIPTASTISIATGGS